MTNSPSPEEVAWAAGLFEGEGCFTIRRDRGIRWPSATTALNMTDFVPVERFAEIVQVGKVYGPYIYGGNKPFIRWQVQGVEGMKTVLALLKPWLSWRRVHRAEEIIEELTK